MVSHDHSLAKIQTASAFVSYHHLELREMLPDFSWDSKALWEAYRWFVAVAATGMRLVLRSHARYPAAARS